MLAAKSRRARTHAREFGGCRVAASCRVASCLGGRRRQGGSTARDGGGAVRTTERGREAARMIASRANERKRGRACVCAFVRASSPPVATAIGNQASGCSSVPQRGIITKTMADSAKCVTVCEP